MKLATVLVRLAAYCLPPHRRNWGEAMQAELPALSPAEALPWALGYLSTACLERIKLLRDVSMLGRFGVAALAGLYGGLALHEIAQVSGHERFGLLLFLCLQSLIYFVAAFALVRRQSRLVIESLVTLTCVRAVFVAAVNSWDTLTAPETLGIAVGTFLPVAVLAFAAAIMWRLPSRDPVAA